MVLCPSIESRQYPNLLLSSYSRNVLVLLSSFPIISFLAPCNYYVKHYHPRLRMQSVSYQAACPPSIRKSLPVIKLLASLIRNTAAPRYSSGFEIRPNIFCLGHSSRRSGNWTNKFSTIAVTMYPGEMVFTRMPYWPHSEARLRPNWMTAALLAL